MKKSLLLLAALWLFSQPLLSQDQQPILLLNPSFEGLNAEGGNDGRFNLESWLNCGFPNETPPDIHPVRGGGFGVTQVAFEGKSYVGMVVRQNDTWESISQRLESPLAAGTCYEFSISLSRSENYLSGTKKDTAKIQYTTPAKLRIWGGSGFCGRTELLAESALVTSYRWLAYNFTFQPKQSHNFIVFEAFYNPQTPFHYNGNLLLDNASAIIPVPCKIETPEVADLPKPKILEELDRSKLKKGQTIRIDQLYFKADSSKMTEASYPVLEELFSFLAANPDVVVEIGGHTNGLPPDDYCDRLSTARAKAVADHLAERGIPRERLQHKGYGKRQPVETNKSDYGRKRNQRVEIKILNFNG